MESLDRRCVLTYAIFILLEFPLCGQMKDPQVESRLSRLVSDYKASPYMTKEPCVPSFQDHGWLFTEENLQQGNGLKIYPENIGHCFLIKQPLYSFTL